MPVTLEILYDVGANVALITIPPHDKAIQLRVPLDMSHRLVFVEDGKPCWESREPKDLRE